jgi:hypothetical protein
MWVAARRRRDMRAVRHADAWFAYIAEVIMLWTLMLVVGCGTPTPDPDDDTDLAETDVAAACVALREGEWEGSGSCFGMSMSADLVLDAEGCSFTFENWNMTMSVPDGGVVDGDTFTLTGTGWGTCEGTATPRSMEGQCEDGCIFEMTLQ